MIEILAPAKLNLGLELLGRRDDGFHEIRSVMAPVSLVDRLRVAPAEEDRLSVGGLTIAAAGNIVAHAMALAHEAWDLPPLDVTLTKRIPLAAGLGGGSSDAAALLIATARLAGIHATPATLGPLAVRLGSDVSFFLGGATALVSGRGEVVTPIVRPTTLHAVIVVPAVTIEHKTATLYGRIVPGDLSDGSEVSSIAADPTFLRRRQPLPNAFRRALYDRLPELGDLDRAMRAAVSLPVNLSGAGPAHYVLCDGDEHACRVSRELRAALGHLGVSILRVRSIAGLQARGGTA